jgi:hypothetical protein
VTKTDIVKVLHYAVTYVPEETSTLMFTPILIFVSTTHYSLVRDVPLLEGRSNKTVRSGFL